MMFEVMEAVQEILDAPVYLVGGCVRDHLLGHEPKDFDFTTPLVPDEIEARVRAAGRKPFLTGKRFGTIGFKVPVGDGFQMVEVTTFRSEQYTDGSRKPVVAFGSNIIEDLGRRDFSMNAIAMRGRRIIDPYRGQEDLQAGILRSVGHARSRMKEDPLRMLRAARFAGKLSLEVDVNLHEAMTRFSHRIVTISPERISSEMDQILLIEDPRDALQLLMDTRVMNFILPEIAIQNGYNQNSKYHSLELWEHTKRVVAGVDPVLELRWAALLHDVAKPATRTLNRNTGYFNYINHDLLGEHMTQSILKRLKRSRDFTDVVSVLVRDHLSDDSPLKTADDAAKGEEGVWTSPWAVRFSEAIHCDKQRAAGAVPEAEPAS